MYINWILDGNPYYPRNGFTNDIPAAYSPDTIRSWMDRLMRVWLDNMGLLP